MFITLWSKMVWWQVVVDSGNEWRKVVNYTYESLQLDYAATNDGRRNAHHVYGNLRTLA
jgi:hypothetical protein